MITLEANYSKKIGLPQFSSHQFSITLKTEITDFSQVQSESARLYKLLQTGVDSSIKDVGFLPSSNGNGNRNGHSNGHVNGKGKNGDDWACSDKQKALILKIVDEHQVDKREIESLAQDRFGKSVKALNKLEASGLIEELLEKHGDSKGNGNRRGGFQKARA